MFKALLVLLERFVAAYEANVEHMIASRDSIGATAAKVGKLTEELAEEVVAPKPVLLAPTDRDVLKKDLEAGDVDFANKAQTITLQKLWLGMHTKAPSTADVVAAGIPARKYTAEEVRAKAIERSAAVGKEKVQAIFKLFSAAKFTELPAERYPEVMSALEALV